MATFSKIPLSGGTNNGRGIEVEATAIGSTPTTIHTGSTTTTDYDEVWIYASNPTGTDSELTIGFGGTTSPDDLIVLNVLAKTGLTLVVPGLILKGASTALIVSAASSTGAGELTLMGFVNRISV